MSVESRLSALQRISHSSPLCGHVWVRVASLFGACFFHLFGVPQLHGLPQLLYGWNQSNIVGITFFVRSLWKLLSANLVSLLNKSTLAYGKETHDAANKRLYVTNVTSGQFCLNFLLFREIWISKQKQKKKNPCHAAVLSVSPLLNPVVPRQPILQPARHDKCIGKTIMQKCKR